ncbi:MAG TPA: cellulose synthase operon protein YhjQ/BcsQ [Lacipirellulaceae bacterium]|nr:cellulose synthase operon protein YhjQ/BcsQ [Lacipirellulaceae bacterium]
MTTNRAFIKAYRHDAAQPAPTPPALTAARQVAGVSATIQLVAAATDFDSAASGQRLSSTAPFADSIDVLPPVATTFEGTTQMVGDFHASQAIAGGTQQVANRIEAIAGRKRPLSAYIGRQRADRTAAVDSRGPTVRPGTTVASFRWPATCRTLAQRSKTDLDAVADLLLASAEQGKSMIGLVGLFSGGGSTTTLLALAARLAVRKRRILLVDGNFHRPQLAASLDAVPTAGWQEVLAGAAPLADAVIRAGEDCLDLLALGATRADEPLRLIAGHEIEACANLIRRDYELALIDLGAFFDVATRPILLELVRKLGIDAALVVSQPEETDARDLAALAEQIGRSGCELLGRIENRVAKSHAKL